MKDINLGGPGNDDAEHPDPPASFASAVDVARNPRTSMVGVVWVATCCRSPVHANPLGSHHKRFLFLVFLRSLPAKMSEPAAAAAPSRYVSLAVSAAVTRYLRHHSHASRHCCQTVDHVP